MRYSTAKGFTLIELLVVMMMLGLLVGLAAPSYRAWLINQQVSQSASAMLAALTQARAEAMRLGKPVTVVPANGTNWTSGWKIHESNNSCATVGDPLTKVDSLSSKVGIASATTDKSFAASNPSYTFLASGFPSTTCASPYYAGTMNARITFSASETGKATQVIVSSTGRARMCDPSRQTCSTDS